MNPLMLLFMAIIGFFAGMLVNYLADVMPIRRRLVRPFCLACKQPQSLAAYFFWPRRCAVCGRRRSLRTWLVELLMVGATVWMWLVPPDGLPFLLGLALLIYFCLVVVIDIEHRLIMHPISLVGAGLGLITGVYLHGLWLSLIGGAAGFAGMMLLYIFGLFFLRLMAFLRRTGVGVDEAVGFGDVTLSGVLGLMLGWPGITAGLILAILLGGLVSFLYLAGMLVARRYQAFSAIPYGPFLIAGAVILIFFRGAFLAAAM